MITSNYPALLPALLAALALGACAKGEEGDTDSAGQTTTATVATTATTQGEEGTSGGTSHVSHGGTDSTAAATTGGMTSTTAEPTTGGGSDLCEAYCDGISVNCSGVHTQYGSPATCMASCAGFLPGTPADTGGNTLGCRTYHAGAAKDMPEVHCTHAGPGGGGACGANCDGFCTLAAHACPEAWADEAACQTACATFAPEESYDATDVGGNTFACRLYHLTAAALDPATHCAHIKGDSVPCK
ncbi:MAG: hypothetical protein H0T76_12610 [Nannocystis sp.]|nr:hypothetical protein [Nannocystis sp.]MBA3547320.1 hypothetical protein [Nannocystis sp.]